MDAIVIVLIVLAVLVVGLFIGGWLVSSRRLKAEEATVPERIREADEHLARAHAQDKGWDRAALEAAARSAYAARHGREPETLNLVQVVDKPGTEEDEAVFQADGERLVLGRELDQWIAR